jgi:hypothetical protein
MFTPAAATSFRRVGGGCERQIGKAGVATGKAYGR